MAGVDLRRDQLVVTSSSQTKDKFWVGNGAFDVLPADCTDAELGRSVERMLAASRTGVRTPDLRKGPSPLAPVMQALGVTSYAVYARGVRHVGVELDGATVTLMPSRNGGSREGFVGLPELAVQLERPETTQLGSAVREALDRST